MLLSEELPLNFNLQQPSLLIFTKYVLTLYLRTSWPFTGNKIHISQLSCNWQTFSEHLQLMFKDLYEAEEKHSDVTRMVCIMNKLISKLRRLFSKLPRFKKNLCPSSTTHDIDLNTIVISTVQFLSFWENWP